MPSYHYGTSTSPKEAWLDLLTHPPTRLAVDTETVNLDDRTLIGLGVAPSPDNSFYFTPDSPEFPSAIKLLQADSIQKVYHNAPYDLQVLRKYKISTKNLDDTSMMGKLVPIRQVPNAPSGRLEDLSYLVGCQTSNAQNLMDKYKAKGRMTNVPIEAVAQKCCTDVTATFLLFDYLKPLINWSYYTTERRLIPMLDIISAIGIKIDQQRRAELDRHYTQEVAYYLTVTDRMGFNPGSPMQVGYMLAKRGNFLPLTKSKRQLATDEKILFKCKDPLARLVLLYRRASKLLSTYIKPLEGADRAYTILAFDTITGRLNSLGGGLKYHINLQNISKQADAGQRLTIRSMFVPDSKVFTEIDANQLELRILAHLSSDSRMKAVFDSGGDIHADTAKGLGTDRVDAKKFNFARLYGADALTIADNIGTTDVARIQYYVERWEETYPEASAWARYQTEKGWNDGYVETLYGRQIPIPLDQGIKHAQNCSINFPIQGTAGEIFKRVMLEYEPQVHSIRNQIHDALLNDGESTIPTGLEDISPVHTPFTLDRMRRWGEKLKETA